MKNRHVILSAAAVLLVAGLTYSACGMQVGPAEGELSIPGDPIFPDAGLEMPPPDIDDPDIDQQRIPPPDDRFSRRPVDPDPMPVVPPGRQTVDLPDRPGIAQVDPEAHRAPQACGGNTCGADELCCWSEGICYAETCHDCCPGDDDRPGPMDEIPMPTTNPVE